MKPFDYTSVRVPMRFPEKSTIFRSLLYLPSSPKLADRRNQGNFIRLIRFAFDTAVLSTRDWTSTRDTWQTGVVSESLILSSIAFYRDVPFMVKYLLSNAPRKYRCKHARVEGKFNSEARFSQALSRVAVKFSMTAEGRFNWGNLLDSRPEL